MKVRPAVDREDRITNLLKAHPEGLSAQIIADKLQLRYPSRSKYFKQSIQHSITRLIETEKIIREGTLRKYIYKLKD